MTDLETILLHCEKEPSPVAFMRAADEYRLQEGEDAFAMYVGLSYMSEHKKFPWKTYGNNTRALCYSWWIKGSLTSRQELSDDLPKEIFEHTTYISHRELTFAAAVLWLGKRLIGLGMVIA